ncbi:MAG: twin-arginine translocase subunit TatC, partial [Parachlamydiaceae bacterium]|nr:twin-arginine translocase subunit TatC [Parachlamydiaceae bacterium]
MEDNLEIHVSFWEHLYELRKSLIAVLVIIMVSTGLCFFFYQPLLRIFGTPLQNLGSNLQIEELSYKRVRNMGNT